MSVEELGEVKRLDVKPGDVLVLELREEPDMAQIKRIHQQLREAFPGQRVVVVSAGTLGLVRGVA